MLGFIKLKGWLAPLVGFAICFGLGFYFSTDVNNTSRPGDAQINPWVFATVFGGIGLVAGFAIWCVDSLRSRKERRRQAAAFKDPRLPS